MSENCSAFTETVDLLASYIKFRIPNISKLQGKFFGPQVVTNGLSFRLMVKPHLNVERRYTSLAAYLCCSGDNGQPMPPGVTCTVNADVIVCPLDHMMQGERFSQAFHSMELNASKSVYGCDELIKWHELLDPRWVKDDVVMIQMSLQILNKVVIPPLICPGQQVSSDEVTTTKTGTTTESVGRVMMLNSQILTKGQGLSNCEPQLNQRYQLCDTLPVQIPDAKFATNPIRLGKLEPGNDGAAILAEDIVNKLKIKDEEDNCFEFDLLSDADK